MKLLIKNGRVIDPANKIDGLMDILVEGTKISKAGKNIKAEADEVIDATGMIVMPGIVDMHVHLREPGREDKETVYSGTKAALKGGVTSILAMPNTHPAIDSAQNLKTLKEIIKKTASANVFIAAALTKGRLGRELTDMAVLKEEGVVAFSDDGVSVDDAGLMKEAFKQARGNKAVVICHSEDRSLSQGGVVNLGVVSTKLGLRGISDESEYKRVERDIRLAEEASASVHIAHISCRQSVELIAKAKSKGFKVTAETCPHYFSLTEDALYSYDTNMKMNPPLRTKDDLSAIKEGLKKGIIDVIASDHAPHTENEKDIEFDRAEFGVIGLETELAAAITELIETKALSWAGLVEKLSLNPAKILGIDKGTLGAGCSADITVVSPDKEWIVKKEEIASKSKNSAFIGRRLKGLVEYTICGGKIAYKNKK